MAAIITIFAALMAYILVAVWFCRVMMKPVSAHFVSDFSLAESANRLSMICMPFNASGLATQRLVGSATVSKVILECRTKGVKRSFSHFTGKLMTDGDKVALSGKFEMAPGTKMTVIFWLTVLVSGLVVVTQKLFVEFSQGMLGLFIVICLILGFIIWVMKSRISEYPDEVSFISANIQSVLHAV